MNYYELLNIERNADANAVKRAYFSAVKIHSPDNDQEGFKAVRLAYETLSNQKKRSEYDSYFVLSQGESSPDLLNKQSGSAEYNGELQNKLLAAREMIRENRYKQAVEYLTGLIGSNPDSEKQLTLFSLNHPDDEYSAVFYTEARRLLAEVLWYMKKSVTAKKICEQMLEKNPSDAGTLLLLAKISGSMGHTEKAGIYFETAVNTAPLNVRAWTEYMRYANSHAYSWVPGIFERAMKQDIDMFRDDYILYLVGIYRTNLFSDENNVQYYNKFAEYFIIDKNHSEEVYEKLIGFIPFLYEKEENIPFLQKILPMLEKSRHRKIDDEELFKTTRTCCIAYKLKFDKRIPDVLVNITAFFLTENTDKNKLLGMEHFIVSRLSDLRPSIKLLKNEYPEFFKFNQAFYLDVLNERKEDYLIDKYVGKFNKLRPSLKKEYFYDDFDDDFDKIEKPMQVIRSSPKTGRNDPCPCGSGKKYKKCCGR